MNPIMSQSRQRGALRPKLIAVSVAACFAFSSPQIFANPTGASVASGSALFAGAGNALTITNSANAIINWHGFSIGINEITRFIQPSALSAVLNRVTGSNGVIPQSVIDGILSSNGRVYLINPSGIVVGAGATIDVSGLVMSSLSLSDQDFLSGRLRFTEVPGAGAVVNNGIIQTAAGGNVYLIAPTVENNGLVRSPQGEIVLAAGKSVELVSDSSPYVTVRVTANTEQAVNVGSLIADSGRIGVYGALVRNAGVAEANGAVVSAGGQIRFVATKDLTIDAGSRISANGVDGGNVLLQAEGGTNLIAGTVEATGSTGKGGSVQALGVRVGVIGNGVIDASGDTGGGTVLVGGDYQGKNSDVQNAERTLIGSDGVIRADARTTGDGGRVIVWADGDTRFFGSVSARGGSQSGDGGFVETSSKGTLQAFGDVNIGAPNGKGGTWLLDPTDANIVAGATSVYGACDSPSTGSICFADPPTTSSVGVANINAALGLALGYGGTVQLQATHDISLQTDVVLTPSGGTIVAQAGNNINFGAHNLVTSGTAVQLSANDNGGGTASGVGSITSTPGFGNITTNGGNISLSGVGVSVGSLNTTAPFNAQSNNGNVQVSSTTGDISTGSITTRSIDPRNAYGGSVSLQTATGRIIVNGSIDTRGANGIDALLYYGGTNSGGVTLSRTTMDSFAGTAVQVTGSILTGGGNAITSSDGFGGTGGNGGSVQIGGSVLSGAVTIGGIDTSGGNGAPTTTTVGCCFNSTSGGIGGSVTINATGLVSVPSITTIGGNAGSTAYVSVDAMGGNGGGVQIQAGSVNAGPMRTGGGAAGDGSGGGHFGGSGGSLYVNAAGAVQIASIDTTGGRGGNGASNAANAPGGDGGEGGSVTVNGSSFLSGSIVTTGGPGGNGGSAFSNASGGQGGFGGSVSVNATGAVQIASIDTTGGPGGNGGIIVSGDSDASGGDGGGGGSVMVLGSSIMTGAVNVSGGPGGAGGSASFALGGWGGSAGSVSYYGGAGGITITGVLLGRGGMGGVGGSVTDGNGYSDSGVGGSGAIVSLTGPVVSLPPSFSSVLSSTGPVSTRMIDVSGGNGANSGPVGTSYTYANPGGDAGSVTIKGTTVTVNGAILARGGDAGIVVDTRFLYVGGFSYTPDAYSGGHGGTVDIRSSGEVKINQGATPSPGLLAIDTRGGVGGRGGAAHNSPASPAGPGGDGGDGGDVILGGTPNITLIGSINTSGGVGGAGGAGAPPIPGGPGGQGGLGGDITLDAGHGSGIISVFAGTTFTLSAGAGGAGGSNGGLAGMTVFDDRLDHNGPGILSILGTVVIIDPLSDPAVSSPLGRIGSCKA